MSDSQQSWQRVTELFEQALEHAPEKRAEFLKSACADDSNLLREVESLLAQHDAETGFLESPALAAMADQIAENAERLPIGKQLGQYRIEALLGRGGMGEVYVAEDRLGRKVALKLLTQQFPGDKSGTARFQQEARTLLALNHPHIVTIHDIDQSEGVYYIASELVEGATLRRRLDEGDMRPEDVLEIAIQVATALAAAHEKGIVHRDIKPENIMIRRDGFVKVLDFGIAKLTEKYSTGESEAPTLKQVQTAEGTVIGTAPYMSPEQARGMRVDARTDIWSLGVMIYEAVAGRKPFSGDTTPDVINSVIEKTPAPLTRYAVDVPEALEWIVSRTLRKEREARYQTANELLTDLKELRTKIELAKAASNEIPAKAASARTYSSATDVRAPTSSAEYVVNEIKRHKTVAAVVVALLALVLAGIGYGIYKWVAKQSNPASPFQSAKLQRLTDSGKASDAAISPDGKWVAHVKSDAGQQSLWLRQVMTTSDTQIVPPSRQNYNGITFSKDGNYIYYAPGGPGNFLRTLYQVSALGGASRKVIENVSSPVSLSPDGTRLAFMRDSFIGETALVVANVDGTGERQVAVRKLPNNFSRGGPSWSPDGKLLASGVTNYDPGAGRASATVVEVQVEGGLERPLTSHTWPPNVGQVAWLADGSGLAVIAFESGTSSSQIWHLSYPDGEVRKITNDLNNYRQLSLTADSSALVTVQTEGASSVWVAPQGDASRAKQISSGRYDGQGGLSWMPGGRIIYTSRGSGLTDIWSMEQDGEDQKQLTANAGANLYPWATPDGRYIVFTSTRARSTRSIWRMDADGGNLKRLTGGPGDILPQSSPDGQWVIFHSTRAGSIRLWKVSIDGGEPVRLTDKITFNPTVSPDGSLIACGYREDQPNMPIKIAIIPFAGGDLVKVLDIPQSLHGVAGLRWTPDGRALTYIDTINGVSNIWSLPLDGGKPVQLTDFKTDQIFWFDFSRDGKQLALSRGTQTSDVILIKDFR